MALEQKLSVRMSQRLIMTPSLQQAIKLLQMSKLELVEEIQQELVENPVLEEAVEEPTREERNEADGDAPVQEAAPVEGEGERAAEERVAEPEPEPYQEIDYESYFQDVDTGYLPRPAMETGDELPSFENTLSKPQDLSDHLTCSSTCPTPRISARPSAAPSSAISTRTATCGPRWRRSSRWGTTPPTRCGPPSR